MGGPGRRDATPGAELPGRPVCGQRLGAAQTRRVAGGGNAVGAGGRRGGAAAQYEGRSDLFALSEPLLEGPEHGGGGCGWQCLDGDWDGDGEACRPPRLRALCGYSCLALALVLVVCATFATQLVQLAVSSSSLSFMAVNITLPSPPTARFRRRGGGGGGRSAGRAWDRALIGFDSMVRISAPALWLWPWAARVGGGNFTLDFSLRPGGDGGGGGGGDGTFVPCHVGTLDLPPLALTGGRASLDMPISGGVLDVSPQNDCFRGFTRGMLLADTLWVTLRGTVDVQVTGACMLPNTCGSTRASGPRAHPREPTPRGEPQGAPGKSASEGAIMPECLAAAFVSCCNFSVRCPSSLRCSLSRMHPSPLLLTLHACLPRNRGTNVECHAAGCVVAHRGMVGGLSGHRR